MRLNKHKLILLLLDVVSIYCSVVTSIWLNNYIRGVIQVNYESSLLPTLVLSLSVVSIFAMSSMYKMHILLDSYYKLVVILKSVMISFGILLTVFFLMKYPLMQQRRIIAVSCINLFIILILYRVFILKYILRILLKNKMIGKKIIIVGAGDKGAEIAHELMNSKYAYFTPIGFLDDNKNIGDVIQGLKVLDVKDNISKYSDEFDEILIAMTNVSYNRLQHIIKNCQKLRKPIHVVSDLFRIIPQQIEVEKFDGFSTFQVPHITGFNQLLYIITKRIMDYTVSILIITLCLPVWIIISLLIKFGSKGPVLYEAEVVGYKENTFVWYKFRSMYYNSDDAIHRQLIKKIACGVCNGEKLENDPRITKIGKWLRKYSIDEFPQLISVLKGQMSLVGPRPVLPYEYELLDEWQKERFTVLPGMTGMWQVHGRSKVNFEDQHVLDLYYVRNRSLLMDLYILFSTISIVISGRGGK